jgi:hypothetical protein
MDELCRSTNPQEGEMICWKFCEKLLHFVGVSDDNYFKAPMEGEDDDMNKSSRQSTSLKIHGADVKLKDIARPFIFLTTHFTSLTKLPEKFNNAIK